MFEQESLQNESMEKYIWNQPLEHPKMVSTKWENTTPFFRTNPARHKMMVYAGHVPTHFMPEISRGIYIHIYINVATMRTASRITTTTLKKDSQNKMQLGIRLLLRRHTVAAIIATIGSTLGAARKRQGYNSQSQKATSITKTTGQWPYILRQESYLNHKTIWE